MPVVEAADDLRMVADHVYVIPPNATLRIAGGKLRISKPAPAREHLRPVDAFELNSKNDTLVHLNRDLKNLLNGTQIATLILDRSFLSKTSRRP